MKILARVDPFPSIAGPLAPVAPPDPALLRLAAACGARRRASCACSGRRAACGSPGAAGSPRRRSSSPRRTSSRARTTRSSSRGIATRDAALRRSSRSTARTTSRCFACPRLAPAAAAAARSRRPAKPVAILGYPENGPLVGRARAGSARRRVVLSEDAYGHGPVARTITAVRGDVRHGNSGGPTVDASGAVATTVFAARLGSKGGFGVPSDVVRKLLRARRTAHAVSTGACADLVEELERALRRPERRDDVDPRARSRALVDHAPRDVLADARRRSAPASRSASCTCSGHDDPRHLVVDALRELQARQRPHADEQRDRRSRRRAARGTRRGTRCRTAPASSRTARRRRACARSGRARRRGRRRSG